MEKCDICGKPANEFESRFLYWTCKEHSKVPPAYRSKAAEDLNRYQTTLEHR